jgi:magnesium chelatase family protein
MCSPNQVHRYLTKISGPLLDRIDIHLDVPSVAYRELSSKAEGTSSTDMRNIVTEARKIQLKRFKEDRPARFSYSGGITCNAQMTTRHIKKYCKLGEDSESLLRQAIDELGLSARAYGRILKVARTIADMEKAENIETAHISEAIQYRSLDRSRFA